MTTMAPIAQDRVLDVGVDDGDWRASNFLEATYPWPDRITAVAPSAMPGFQARFPAVSFVVGDGRALPFADRSFEIGFSNAVIEHVGGREDQRRLVAEMLRTCRRVFICTPNAGFPIDPHTLLPFVHWLPRGLRHPILRATGNGRWASVSTLEPLTAGHLLALFPAASRPRLIRQRAAGLATVLIVVAGLP